MKMTIRIVRYAVTVVVLGAWGAPGWAQDTPPAPVTPPENGEVSAQVAGPGGGDGLRFNFQDVPLDTVLNYLSETAGFIIVREAQVDGRVDVVSHQPLSKDEAVELLNTVLNQKGFAAIRNERTLTIVKREEAGKRNIPVKMGNNPEAIPKSDEMVTQVIPIRHTDATQLLETLTPLLPSYAVATANKSSNAIVLTDTQTNIRRMAEIVRALDTSISEISEVKVYSLVHAKAADVAKMITSLFDTSTQTNQGNQGGGNPFRQFFGRGGGGPGGGDNQQGNNQDSAARQAAMRVQAVADERTNSLVVSAPSDILPLIDTLIDEIDKVSPPATEIRVFPLEHADSEEMAQVINSTFEATNTAANSNQAQGRRFFGGGPGMPPGFPGGGNNQQTTQSGTTVVKAVSDYRTNSVVVTAETTLMDQIAAMIAKLDSDPSKQQKVFVYKLKNADVESVAQIVQGLISQDVSSQGTTTRRSTTSTQNRSTTNTNRNTNSTRTNTGTSRTRN